MWSELVDSHPDVWDAELRDGSPTVIATVMPQAQRKLTRAQADADAEAMFERLEQRAEQPADAANATLTLQTLARLRSVSCRPASAFLDALPVAPTLRLSDRDFRSALQLRLGLLEVLSAAIELTCGCKRKLCERCRARAAVQTAQRGIHVAPRHPRRMPRWARAHWLHATSTRPSCSKRRCSCSETRQLQRRQNCSTSPCQT